MAGSAAPAEPKRRTLGMGLSALFGEESREAELASRPPRPVAVSALRPGRYQPRRHFDTENLEALTQSIREKGILQPLLVRPHPGEPDAFEIIAGERRWRAAQRAQLHEVPVLVLPLSDREAAEVGLIENLQRDDLSPIEEAQAYTTLMTEFFLTQEKVSQTVGKSRSHVANTLRLLETTPKVQKLLATGVISAGHARALIGATDGDRVAEQIVRKGLSVRQVEALVNDKRKPVKPQRPAVDTQHAAEDLSARWGLQVEIREGLGGMGVMLLRYKTLAELEAFIRRVR